MGCCHSSQTVQGNDNFISNVDNGEIGGLEQRNDPNIASNGALNLKNSNTSQVDVFKKLLPGKLIIFIEYFHKSSKNQLLQNLNLNIENLNSTLNLLAILALIDILNSIFLKQVKVAIRSHQQRIRIKFSATH